MGEIICFIIQSIFLITQILIAHYQDKHKKEMTEELKRFSNIAYYFCMTMVIVMAICVFII